jgi:hypothetical protein
LFSAWGLIPLLGLDHIWGPAALTFAFNSLLKKSNTIRAGDAASSVIECA